MSEEKDSATGQSTRVATVTTREIHTSVLEHVLSSTPRGAMFPCDDAGILGERSILALQHLSVCTQPECIAVRNVIEQRWPGYLQQFVPSPMPVTSQPQTLMNDSSVFLNPVPPVLIAPPFVPDSSSQMPFTLSLPVFSTSPMITPNWIGVPNGSEKIMKQEPNDDDDNNDDNERRATVTKSAPPPMSKHTKSTVRSPVKTEFEVSTNDTTIGFKCPYCDYTHIHKSRLETHMKIHSGEKPFVCQECGFRSNQKAVLIKHRIKKHGVKDPYFCERCDLTFSTPHALSEHRKSHRGEKPYQCPFCFQGFAYYRNFIEHVHRKHADDDERETTTTTTMRPAAARARSVPTPPQSVSESPREATVIFHSPLAESSRSDEISSDLPPPLTAKTDISKHAG